MKKSILSGGGYAIAKNVRAGVKVEPKPKAISVEATAQQGAALAFKRKPLVSGPGFKQGKMPPTGVGNATVKSDTPAPGSGRTIYAKGTQATYGPVNPGIPKPAPRDILSEYGPERSKG